VKFASRVFALLVVFSFQVAEDLDRNGSSLDRFVTDPSSRGNFQCENNGLATKPTNLTQEATTDSSGSYFFSEPSRGDLYLTVEQNGFNKATAEITLEPRKERRQDIELQVGQTPASR